MSNGRHRLLLDVSSMGYRAYFALRDSVKTPDGRSIGLVYGYLDMVGQLVATRRPDEVIHVYDHDWRPMARTQIYPAYKGNRQPDPEDLPGQFELLRTVLDATGMLQLHAPDWEAEDAIGAAIADGRDDDLNEIVSGDRDLIQLVRDPQIKLLFTKRGVSDLLELDEAGVLEKYGVPASRYSEFAILRGDPSDGLPGVRGIGEKTARTLVQLYPSIDAMLEVARSGGATGPLAKPSVKASLLASEEYLDAMWQIVPINVEAKLEVWGGERDDVALKELGKELGIGGPIQRLLAALDSAGTETA